MYEPQLGHDATPESRRQTSLLLVEGNPVQAIHIG